MDLYHAEIGLPRGFVRPTARVPLLWTRHALQARQNDRYGVIPHMNTINLAKWQVVEVGVEDGRVRKILFRGRISNSDLDICIVLIPDFSVFRGPWTVKTVWINERNDSHKTLDRTKYVN